MSEAAKEGHDVVMLLDESGERICAVPARSITDRDGHVEEELGL